EFRDAGSCPAKLEAASEGAVGHCLDFDPGPGVDETFGIEVEPGEELNVDLQWAEPWDGVNADIDTYLLNEQGGPLNAGGPIAGSQDDNPVGDDGLGTDRPFEYFSWENNGKAAEEVQLAVDLCFDKPCNEDGAEVEAGPIKFILLQNGGSGISSTEYPKS